MALCIVMDASINTSNTMDEDKFINQLRIAEQRRKAKHFGRFSMEEFRKMFGMPSCSLDRYLEIDKKYPISFVYSVFDVIGSNVDCYTLTYQTKMI